MQKSPFRVIYIVIKKYAPEVFTFAFLFYFLSLFLPLPDPTYGDESWLLNGAYRILQGDIIYKDFAEYIAPAPFFFLAWLFKLFGTKLLVARMLNYICICSITIFLYLILLKLTKNKFLSISTIIIYTILGYSFWYITSHHWLLIALELIIIFLLIKLLKTQKNIYIIFAGFLSGILPFLVQHKGGVFTLSTLIWLIIVYYKRDKKNLLYFLLTCSIIPLVFLSYFLTKGALLDMVKNIFLLSQSLHSSKNVAFPYYFFSGWSAIKMFYKSIELTDPFVSIYIVFKIVYYIILGYSAFLTFPVFIIQILNQKNKINVMENNENFYLKILILIAGISQFLIILPLRTDQYQIIMIFPFIIFPAILLINSVKRFKYFLISFFSLLTIGALFYGVQWSRTIIKYYTFKVEAPTGDKIYFDNKLMAEDMQNFYNYSRVNMTENEIIAFYIGDPFYFFLQKKNPLYFNTISPVHFDEKTFRNIVLEIKKINPKHIIWDRFGTREWNYAAFPFLKLEAEKFVKNPLIDFIKGNYEVVALFPVANIVLYKRK